METKDILKAIRTKHHLTQDDMADKLFVTRQAVSRWENGDSTPNIETLKQISITFDVLAAESASRLILACKVVFSYARLLHHAHLAPHASAHNLGNFPDIPSIDYQPTQEYALPHYPRNSGRG